MTERLLNFQNHPRQAAGGISVSQTHICYNFDPGDISQTKCPLIFSVILS